MVSLISFILAIVWIDLRGDLFGRQCGGISIVKICFSSWLKQLVIVLINRAFKQTTNGTLNLKFRLIEEQCPLLSPSIKNYYSLEVFSVYNLISDTNNIIRNKKNSVITWNKKRQWITQNRKGSTKVSKVLYAKRFIWNYL
jgi:hypothetical protein